MYEMDVMAWTGTRLAIASRAFLAADKRKGR